MDEGPPKTCFFSHTIEVDGHTSLKNTKRLGRGRMYTDPRVKHAQEFLVLSLQARARELHFDKPWGSPLLALWKLELANYWTKTKPIRLNRKAGDISNLIQSAEDALTKASIIEDDSLIVEMTAIKIPSHRNAIGIYLYPMRPQNYDFQTCNKPGPAF